jgi:hypothetical protein
MESRQVKRIVGGFVLSGMLTVAVAAPALATAPLEGNASCMGKGASGLNTGGPGYEEFEDYPQNFYGQAQGYKNANPEEHPSTGGRGTADFAQWKC